MSFRDNLLRLRTEHGMTQEQLASQIGVSRQSVAKWESDRSYPEMDKLIKMTGIFGCTLDELVMGPAGGDAADDLAPVAVAVDEPAAAAVAGAVAADAVAAVADAQPAAQGEAAAPASEWAPSLEPATDSYGYDAHMRSYAKRLASGVSVIIAGVPAFIAANGLLGADSEAVNVLSLALLLGFIIAGLALIIPSVMGHSAFMREHPVVRDFYTLSDKQLARQALSRGIVVGIALIFAGIIVSGAAGFVLGGVGEELGACLLLLCIAVAVWCFIHYGIMFSRVRVVEYNHESLEQIVESYGESSTAAEALMAQLSPEERKLLFDAEDIDANDPEQVAAFFASKKKAGKLLGGICGIIMVLATIVGLCLLFGVPVASDYFWMAWVVGGLLCALVSIIMNTFAK